MKIALVTTLAVLAFPAAASASWVPYVPPSNSGANQYVESVPSASGNTSTGTVRSHRPTSGKALAAQPGAVSPRTEAALLAAGNPGRVTAVLAATTGPRLPAQSGTHHTKQHSGVAGSPSDPSSGGGGSGSSGAGSVVGALTGTSGTSGLLPVALALSALALAAIAVARRRRVS